MKKMKGTRYAHIGTSWTPIMDAEIAKLEAAVLNQQARLDEAILKVKGWLREGEDFAHWGE